MGRSKKSSLPAEGYLNLPAHPSYSNTSGTTICDTHTHLLSTFSTHRQKYTDSPYLTVYEFARGLYASNQSPPNVEGTTQRHKISSIVDVWCEAPVRKEWKELADSAISPEDQASIWGGIQYYFVLGVHPHEAKLYNEEVEEDILEAMRHPRCVGFGEIGLDYHYSLSPREIQQEILARQLRIAVRLGKPLTIHTREADEDIERILKAEVPREHPIHVHCFTDSVDLAKNLLEHFPNLYIGITGVITYSTNLNTPAVIQHLLSLTPKPESSNQSPLRILLETDAPYMIPGNLTSQKLSLKSGQKLPYSHSGMIPWTAEFVANIAGEGWDANRVLQVSRTNAKAVYGI